jgi:hypothetical protein
MIVFDNDRDCYTLQPSHGTLGALIEQRIKEAREQQKEKEIRTFLSTLAPVSEPVPHSDEYYLIQDMARISCELAAQNDPLPANAAIVGLYTLAPTYVPPISRSHDGHWWYVHNNELKFISHKE